MGNVIGIPVSQRARAREALREHFGEGADIEPWLERWVGTFENLEAYVGQELEEILPPRDQWLAAYVDTSALARDWQDCCRVIYGRDRHDRVHVFAWLELHAMNPARRLLRSRCAEGRALDPRRVPIEPQRSTSRARTRP